MAEPPIDDFEKDSAAAARLGCGSFRFLGVMAAAMLAGGAATAAAGWHVNGGFDLQHCVLPALVLMLAVACATAVAIAFWKKRCIESFAAELEIRRQAEMAALDREGLLDVTFASIGDAVIATDTLGRIQRMNFVAEKLTGWPFSEARGKKLSEVFKLVDEQTRGPVENPLDKVLRENVVVMLASHALLVSRDGKERPVADSAAPIRSVHGDGILGVVLVFRDQSADRAAQNRMEDSERRYRHLFDDSPNAVFLCDGKGYFLDANKAMSEWLGYDRGELLRMRVSEVDAGFDAAMARSQAGSVWKKDTRGIETLFRRRGGDFFPIELFLSSAEADGGGAIAIAVDITRRKDTENALRESERKYKMLFDGMLDGFTLHEIILDSAGAPVNYRFLDVNPAFERITGLPASKALGRTATDLISGLEPELIRTYGEVAIGGVAKSFETHIAHFDKWFEIVAFPAGQMRFACVFKDITARRRMTQSMAMFKSLLDNIDEAILELDFGSGRIVDVNERACSMLGYEREELLGKRSCDIDCRFNNDPAERARFMAVVDASKETVVFDTKYRRKDGLIIPVQVKLKLTELGGVKYSVAIISQKAPAAAA